MLLCWIMRATNSFPKMQPLAPRAAELCEHTFSPGLSIASVHRRHCLSAKTKAGPCLVLQDRCWPSWEQLEQWQTCASIKLIGGTGAESQVQAHQSADNDGRKSAQKATPPKLKLKMQVNQSRKGVKRQEKPKVTNFACIVPPTRLFQQNVFMFGDMSGYSTHRAPSSTGNKGVQLSSWSSQRPPGTCGKTHVVTYSGQPLATYSFGRCEQLGN